MKRDGDVVDLDIAVRADGGLGDVEVDSPGVHRKAARQGRRLKLRDAHLARETHLLKLGLPDKRDADLETSGNLAVDQTRLEPRRFDIAKRWLVEQFQHRGDVAVPFEAHFRVGVLRPQVLDGKLPAGERKGAPARQIDPRLPRQLEQEMPPREAEAGVPRQDRGQALDMINLQPRHPGPDRECLIREIAILVQR